MLELIRRYQKDPLSSAAAANLLRLLFAAMFMLQLLIAGGLAIIFRSFSSGVAHPLIGQSLVALALLQFPLALGLGFAASRAGGRQAALSASLLLSVLLATPAYFTAFAYAVRVSLPLLATLLGITGFYYLIGVLLCGFFAKTALQAGKESPATKTEAEPHAAE